MKNVRISLKGKGTVNGNQYTRSQVVSALCEYKDALASDFRSRFDSKMPDRKWILEDMNLIANSNGLAVDSEFRQLNDDLIEICRTITTYSKGLHGEHDAMRAMSRLLPGEEMEVIHNITIEDGDECTEFDSIVITPYGIFTIEVKSYGQEMTWDEKGIIGPTYGKQWKKDLGERMNCKEFLIRKELAEYASVPFHNILLISDNRVKIRDNYKRVSISYLNTIMADIRNYSRGERYLSTAEIQAIKQKLMANNKPVYVDCPIDCDRVSQEYEWFLNRIEEERNKGIINRVRRVLSWVTGAASSPETA